MSAIFPPTIAEGLSMQGFTAPRPRVYARRSSSGEWVTIGIVAALSVGFVGLILIPYLRREGLGASPMDALRS